MKKVIITGATSMLGSELVRECVENNVRVLAIVRKNSPKISRIMESSLITILESDLDKLNSIDIMENEYDAFYHFAWDSTSKDKRDDVVKQSKNIEYTLDSVKLAKKCGCKVT